MANMENRYNYSIQLLLQHTGHVACKCCIETDLSLAKPILLHLSEFCCQHYFYIVLTFSTDWSCASVLIWKTFSLEEELCCIHQLALHQTVSSLYNITLFLLHFVQNCIFKPNNLENVCILLGHGNCQCMSVTEQTVTNFLFLFSPVPFLHWQRRPWGSAFSPVLGEPLDNQTAPGSHAKVCGSFQNWKRGSKEERKSLQWVHLLKASVSACIHTSRVLCTLDIKTVFFLYLDSS